MNITFKSKEQLLEPESHPTFQMYPWENLKKDLCTKQSGQAKI